MTKRFIEDGIMVKDTMNKLPPILTHSNQQQKEFLNALNELNDENQQLKEEVKSLKEDLGFIDMELEEMEDLE